ncbi:MAG: ankyrin repeat domain-containing protein [Synergistales bacterium]
MEDDDINWVDEDEFQLATEPESLEHGKLGLFLKAVPTLMAHLEGLLSHPAKSAVCVPFVEFYISFKYGQVRRSLPIGCILREWKKGRLMETCPHCGGPLYVYRSFAQLLEGGRQRWSGYCPFCETETHGSDPDRVTLFRSDMARALENWGLHIKKTDDRSPQQFDEPFAEMADTVAKLQAVEHDLQFLEDLPPESRWDKRGFALGLKLAREAVEQDDPDTLGRLSFLGFSFGGPDEAAALLMEALENGQVNAIDWLLRMKADPRGNDEGALALYKAVKSGSAWAVERLLTEGIGARMTFRGMSLLAHAVKGENLPAARLLVEYGADREEGGLAELAAQYGDAALVRLTLPLQSLFSTASLAGLLVIAARARNFETFRCLLDESFAENWEGFPELETVLREALACGEGDFGQHLMLEALLGHGLSLEFRLDGKPLLFWAARNKPGLVPFFLEKGSSLYAAENLQDVKDLRAAIRNSGIPDRNARWGVALRRLEDRFSEK